jgi:uncharacterized protein (DUF4415 family)
MIFEWDPAKRRQHERHETMSEKHIKTYTSEELDAMIARGEDRTDWRRLREMKDEDIDCSDIAELDEAFWANAEVVMLEPKENISIRVSRRVLSYFRKDGPGYKTRMHAVLESFVDAQERNQLRP